MSYELYQTEGVIIKSREIGEADKFLSVFTKDFGRIELLAKGARKLNSKLNFHLNTFDYSRFAFVSGKEFWRLTDAEKISSWPKVGNDKLKIESLANIGRFLEKMLRGEDKNENLWRLLKTALMFLNDREFKKDDLKIFEALIILRILFLLGYVDNSDGLSAELTANSEISYDFLNKYKNFRPQILKIIRDGISMSGL